jgi:hypothetical protein
MTGAAQDVEPASRVMIHRQVVTVPAQGAPGLRLPCLARCALPSTAVDVTAWVGVAPLVVLPLVLGAAGAGSQVRATGDDAGTVGHG